MIHSNRIVILAINLINSQFRIIGVTNQYTVIRPHAKSQVFGISGMEWQI